MSEDSPYVAGCEIEYDAAGHSMVGDEYIVNVPLETPRAKRIATRLASGGVLKDCVKYGYVIGRDDAATARGYAHLLAFLKRAFSGPR